MAQQVLAGLPAVSQQLQAAAWLLVFGTFVNPLLFGPLAFSKEVEQRLWFRAASVVSFLAIAVALVWAAVLGPGF